MPEDETEKRQLHRVDICLRLIAIRQLVGRHIGFDLSADPIWDMLLDLYISAHRKRDIAISSLASAANVPATTALRCIRTMRQLGWVSRQPDPDDGRRIYIRLTWKAHAALAEIFDAIADRASSEG